MRISQGLMISFGLVALLPVSLVSMTAYTTITKEIKTRTLAQLDATVTKQKQKVNIVLQRQREMAINLATKYQLRLAVEKWQTDKTAGQKEIEQVLEAAKDGWPELLNASVYAHQSELKMAGDGQGVTNPLGTDKSIWLQPDKNGESELVIKTPITVNNQIRGLLVVEVSSEEIDSIVGDYGGLGKSGETAIAALDRNNNAVYLYPLRHDPEAAFKRKVLAKTQNNPMLIAFKKLETVLDNVKDYRNKQVLAAVRYIDLADWGLVAKIDRDEAYAPVYELGNRLIMMTGIIAVVAVIIASIIGLWISQSAVKLTRAVKQIAQGNLEEKINFKSWEEVEMLAGAFNEMTSKLKASYNILEDKVRERTEELESAKKQLEKVNIDLDKKVQERTKELEELKEQLETTVTQRTEELKVKLEEMEKMNRLMTGRELKMVELKAEIERLKKKS